MPKKKTIFEAVSGGLGSGKSNYALSSVDSCNTFVLGAGSRWHELLNSRFGSIQKHINELQERGFKSKSTRPWTIVQDIQEITQPVVLIDEWTTFRHYTLFWTNKKVAKTIRQIFDAFDDNPHIIKVVFVCSDCVPYLPFSLYKKTVLWNKLLFKAADKITIMYFGIPSVLKKPTIYLHSQ